MRRDIRTYTKNKVLVDERRQHIVSCSLKVFLEKGYRGSNIRNLAQACGMSEVNLYRYIGSKDDILRLMCMDTAGRTEEELEAFFGSLRDVSPAEALGKCFRYYLQMVDSQQDSIMFFNREIGSFSSADRRMLMGEQEKVVQFFERLLIDGVNAGEFQMDSPFAVALDIHMKVHAWVLRRWLLRQRLTLENYASIHSDLILESIRANRGERNKKRE